MADDPLLASLRAAVEARPDDAALRLHLAELLLAGGHHDEAVGHVAAVLGREPSNPGAATLMARALAGPAPEPGPGTPAADPPPGPAGFDWDAAEAQVSDVGMRFSPDDAPDDTHDDDTAAGTVAPPPGAAGAARFAVERPDLRLDDVGGMEAVKKRLTAAFLAPLRHAELRALYGKSLRGGLLLYGPPGCGKTFFARALAGELGASFLSVGVTDVLDPHLGRSEQNVRDAFRAARAHAPCVLFFDELDGIGQKRSSGSWGAAIRPIVTQLLSELDGVAGGNDGVFVLAASNMPWDVDPALRRPGRFDRMSLVVPPDDAARRAILTHHLRDRPVEGVRLKTLAARTEGFSGADLAHLCESATERALMDSVATGTARRIGMDDLLGAAAELRPSTGPWYTAARQVALYANGDGAYDELVADMRRRKLL